MSLACMVWVLYHSAAEGNDRLVLLSIADEADDDGRNAFPGVERIADKARVHPSTAMRAVARLEATGELLVRRPDRNGRGRHNRYVVCMGRDPAALAAELGWPIDGAQAVDDAVDDTAGNVAPCRVSATGKPADSQHEHVEKPAPDTEKGRTGASQPIDPLTQDPARACATSAAGSAQAPTADSWTFDRDVFAAARSQLVKEPKREPAA